MRPTVLAGAVVLGLTLWFGAAGADDVAGVRRQGDPGPGVKVDGANTATLMDGWNHTQPYASAGSYGARCFGFAYVPSQSYSLERIEFYAGGVAGTVSVSVHQDVGSNFPTGPVLGSVTYPESAILGWQGGNLAPTVVILAGSTYYIKYVPVNFAPVSTASTGILIPHSWADECSLWQGPAASFFWMARFHGSPLPTANAQTTWSAIKRLYR